MKAMVKIEQEVEIAFIQISVAVSYGEEDIPNNFPLRKGDLWEALVNIDTGQIQDWPQGLGCRLRMKVVDQGTYTLMDATHRVIVSRSDSYVPHGVVPGEYGDYIDLKIDKNGVITNWPKKPDVSEFFDET